MQEGIAELTRERVSEALFFIGFGVVWVFNLWWPGILIAFGLPWSASLAIRRKYWSAAMAAVLLCVAPAAYMAFQAWDGLVPAMVIGVGMAELARALYLDREGIHF